MLMSATLMLRHLELTDKAKIIEDAIIGLLAEGTIKTKDLGGDTTTTEFCNKVAERI